MIEHEQFLTVHFRDRLDLPPAAVDWLLALWNAIQVLDDVVDKDEVNRADLDRAVLDLLFCMPTNPFFAANAAILAPVVGLAVLKWKAADTAEREGNVTPTSFVWRAGYYDVVLAAVVAVHGPQTTMTIADNIMSLYGEDYNAYLKEFGKCQIPSAQP